MPVHDEEWDGDIPIGVEDKKQDAVIPMTGSVVFNGERLPWQVGTYEVGMNHFISYKIHNISI